MPEGSNPTEGSQADLATELLAEQQAAAQASAPETPVREEPGETPDASDASAEDQPDDASSQEEGTESESEDAQNEDSEVQYERLSAKLKAGRALSKVDLKAIEDLERRSVPYKEFTKMRQRDREEVKSAQARATELEARAKQLDEALPILKAISESPDIIQMLEPKLSATQRQQLDPAIAPLVQEVQSLRSEVEATKNAAGDKMVQDFVNDHADLLDDPYLKNKWVEAAYNAAKMGVEDALDIAYDVVKAQVARERAPQQSKAKLTQKQMAAMPTGSARAPQPAPQKTEAELLKEALLGGVAPLQGVNFQ